MTNTIKDELIKKLNKSMARLSRKLPKNTGSEFGKGLIYNLVLFAEHFNNDQAKLVSHLDMIMKKPKAIQKLILSDNPPAQYNYGKDIEMAKFYMKQILPIHQTPAKLLSSTIEMWANGATDHLYEMQRLDVTPVEQYPYRMPDKEVLKINNMLDKLVNTGLSMGHGMNYKKTWKAKDMWELQDLTKEIAMALDKKMGISTIKGTYE